MWTRLIYYSFCLLCQRDDCWCVGHHLCWVMSDQGQRTSLILIKLSVCGTVCTSYVIVRLFHHTLYTYLFDRLTSTCQTNSYISKFLEVDILGVDILGVDILGVDILRVDILGRCPPRDQLTRNQFACGQRISHQPLT